MRPIMAFARFVTPQRPITRMMELAVDMRRKGKLKKDIVISLNKQGFKTRTGKPWTDSILNNELKKFIKPEDDLDFI